MKERLQTLAEQIEKRYDHLFKKKTNSNGNEDGLVEEAVLEGENEEEEEKADQYFDWEIVYEPNKPPVFVVSVRAFPPIDLRLFRATDKNKIQEEALHIPDSGAWKDFASQLGELMGYFSYFNLESIKMSESGKKSPELLHLLFNFNPVKNNIPAVLFNEIRKAPQEVLLDLITRHYVIEDIRKTGSVVPKGEKTLKKVSSLVTLKPELEKALETGYTEIQVLRERLDAIKEIFTKSKSPFEVIDENPDSPTVMIRQPFTKTRQELINATIETLPIKQLSQLVELAAYREFMPLVAMTALGITFRAEYFPLIIHQDAQTALELLQGKAS